MHTCVNYPPSAQDLQIIEQQIGRPPKGIHSIAAIDGEGTPLVLRMHSVVDHQPFPTLYWLTSPLLKKELSHIESRGLIKVWEDELQADPELLAEYHASHQDYIRQRWHFMSAQDKVWIQNQQLTELFTQRGIGGIANWQQIRCLHTQYAHHLCGDNVIGRRLDQKFAIADYLP
ncbi:hypothetical protein SAMN05421831_11342 [Allopseudospirillum japonicum]|uniref:DUF501 domain-containing protein n=1 Tax=Allopseudospirillum japonicum TaxID=64971 RepID=A0A1H6U5J5_9GAMM|nr:DUF501 domain-containing protein [Allopseudospirillum japonicum]SEI85794.1 hypothetical protein SAMN05421831_11342 [Allopseudospirillum japonicum]